MTCLHAGAGLQQQQQRIIGPQLPPNLRPPSYARPCPQGSAIKVAQQEGPNFIGPQRPPSQAAAAAVPPAAPHTSVLAAHTSAAQGNSAAHSNGASRGGAHTDSGALAVHADNSSSRTPHEAQLRAASGVGGTTVVGMHSGRRTVLPPMRVVKRTQEQAAPVQSREPQPAQGLQGTSAEHAARAAASLYGDLPQPKSEPQPLAATARPPACSGVPAGSPGREQGVKRLREQEAGGRGGGEEERPSKASRLQQVLARVKHDLYEGFRCAT